jgi:hypothetical protein
VSGEPPEVRAVFLAVHLLTKLGEELLVKNSPDTEREMLKRTRQLTRILERRLLGECPAEDENVVDLERQKSRRAVMAELGVPARPDPRPPRAA